MRWKYKVVMFLTLLIFCVGSVCATEPDNTTVNNVTGDGGLNPVNPPITNTTDIVKNTTNIVNVVNMVNSELEKRDIIINNQDLRIKALKNNVNELNNIVNNQSVTINELNNKLDLQLVEIKQLQADKDKLNDKIDKLNDEIKENYKKLLESPKKEDFDQLKKDIANKDNKIKELNAKIKVLNNILSVNSKEVVNSLKVLSSTKNIKCGKYTFSLDEYLKIPLIKDGKNRVIKYKKSQGRLPNYVTIADYEVPKNVYQKLFNIK